MPQPSSAADVTQAHEDVERLAEELFATVRAKTTFLDQEMLPPIPWSLVPEQVKKTWRAAVTELLHRDVIRVGKRPQRGEPPMTGQTTLTPVEPLTGGPDLG